MPAARGAEAEVPVCLSVHLWCRSVVTWGHREGLGALENPALVQSPKGFKKEAPQKIITGLRPRHWPCLGDMRVWEPWGLVPGPRFVCQVPTGQPWEEERWKTRGKAGDQLARWEALGVWP